MECDEPMMQLLAHTPTHALAATTVSSPRTYIRHVLLYAPIIIIYLSSFPHLQHAVGAALPLRDAAHAIRLCPDHVLQAWHATQQAAAHYGIQPMQFMHGDSTPSSHTYINT